MGELPSNISEMVKGPIGHPDVVRVLEAMLAQAKAGSMVGVVVIAAVGPENIALNVAGACPVTLAGGCAQMQRMLLDQAFAQKRSSLVVPAGRG